MGIINHPSYKYASDVVSGAISAPKYVKAQAKRFIALADNRSPKYFVDESKVKMIDQLLGLLIMPTGLKAGKTIKECSAGFQWLLYIASLCVVWRENPNKRRYENITLEICRKNGKTFIIAVLFILLFFMEPKFSKFFSVAADGSLSRLVKEMIFQIIQSSPALEGKFKIRRDDILCLLTQNDYVPLNYSTSRLDGRLASVFLVDETGALPSPYALEAMRSGQLTVLNKLGFVISTKYPTAHNVFEDEIAYDKRVLDGLIEDDKRFALLYEPDDTLNWATNDEILMHGNPLALEIPDIMEDLLAKRQYAIEVEGARENFITKHCNIVYQGADTESYINVPDVQKCKVDKINWEGKEVYLGLDLALTTDNCSVVMVGVGDNGKVIAEAVAFIPADRIEEKNKVEHIDYRRYMARGKCFACGGRTVDYGYIENFILGIEEKYGVKVIMIGFDRANCLSTAQKLEAKNHQTVEVTQLSSVLHGATKLLKELILDQQFEYEANDLYEINFGNCRCSYSANLNMYVNKKKSNGKVDMVVATIIALYLLNENVFLGDQAFGFQIG